jgi:aryl-alcohol dehydrogenase-like predicted oxidoreductase
MKIRNIPHTDLHASVLCLGTAEFGSGIEDSFSTEIVDRYVAAGGNVLDTAEIYASQANGYFRRLERGTIDQASQLVKDLFHHPLNERRYERIKAVEKQTGLDQGAISLGYLLSQPFPVFPIIGPRKLSDLEESLKVADTVLTPQQVEFLTAGQ